MRLVITTCTSRDSGTTPVDTVVARSTTVLSLKELIARQIGFILAHHTPKEVRDRLGRLRLRRSIKTKDFSAILFEEALDLKALELEDGATIKLEEERLPRVGEVVVLFYGMSKGFDYERGALGPGCQATPIQETTLTLTLSH